jgi:hypothetical protein
VLPRRDARSEPLLGGAVTRQPRQHPDASRLGHQPAITVPWLRRRVRGRDARPPGAHHVLLACPHRVPDLGAEPPEHGRGRRLAQQTGEPRGAVQYGPGDAVRQRPVPAANVAGAVQGAATVPSPRRPGRTNRPSPAGGHARTRNRSGRGSRTGTGRGRIVRPPVTWWRLHRSYCCDDFAVSPENASVHRSLKVHRVIQRACSVQGEQPGAVHLADRCHAGHRDEDGGVIRRG